jgi:hypothetical protein
LQGNDVLVNAEIGPNLLNISIVAMKYSGGMRMNRKGDPAWPGGVQFVGIETTIRGRRHEIAAAA